MKVNLCTDSPGNLKYLKIFFHKGSWAGPVAPGAVGNTVNNNNNPTFSEEIECFWFITINIIASLIDDRAPLRAATRTMDGCQESRGLENATCSSRTTSGSLIIINYVYDLMMLSKCSHGHHE